MQNGGYDLHRHPYNTIRGTFSRHPRPHRENSPPTDPQIGWSRRGSPCMDSQSMMIIGPMNK